MYVCKVIEGDNAQDETFSHLFFECKTTQKMLRYTIENLAPELANNSELNTIFWLGKKYNEMVMDSCPKYLLIFETFRYIIWRKKIS